MMLGTTLTVFVIVAVVSMVVAVVIRGLVAVLGRSAATTPPAPAVRPAAPGTTATPQPPTGQPENATAGGHDPRHVAAICAAVASTFDDAAVVVRIEPARGAAGWTSEVRAAHHGSHDVGHRSR